MTNAMRGRISTIYFGYSWSWSYLFTHHGGPSTE